MLHSKSWHMINGLSLFKCNLQMSIMVWRKVKNNVQPAKTRRRRKLVILPTFQEDQHLSCKNEVFFSLRSPEWPPPSDSLFFSNRVMSVHMWKVAHLSFLSSWCDVQKRRKKLWVLRFTEELSVVLRTCKTMNGTQFLISFWLTQASFFQLLFKIIW